MRSIVSRILPLVLAVACSGGSSSAPSGSTQPGGTGGSAVDPPAGACTKSGCGGTVCVEAGQDVMTTCEFRPEHACYQKATCEKQPNGACGWTQNAELTACLANPPPM